MKAFIKRITSKHHLHVWLIDWADLASALIGVLTFHLYNPYWGFHLMTKFALKNLAEKMGKDTPLPETIFVKPRKR